jgi:hypothetical protein
MKSFHILSWLGEKMPGWGDFVECGINFADLHSKKIAGDQVAITRKCPSGKPCF